MNSPQAETKCLSPSCGCQDEARQAQVRDRDLCRCGDQRAAHRASRFADGVRCSVEGCPCERFHASGDNLEQGLKAMGDGDEAGELEQWRKLGKEIGGYPDAEVEKVSLRARSGWLPEVRDLLARHQAKDGMARLEADVVALPPDGSPQQRWRGDLDALVARLRDAVAQIPHGPPELITDTRHWAITLVDELRAELELMPAPFDWNAVREDVKHQGVSSRTAGFVAANLECLWLGGTRAGD